MLLLNSNIKAINSLFEFFFFLKYYLKMVFKYIDVIDEGFDISLFSEAELDNLEAVVEFNRYRISRGASLRFSNRYSLGNPRQKIKLPKYAPPNTDKRRLLNTFDIYSNRTPKPTKPVFPICVTNTALCNYVHQRYIYQQFLSEQLRRQYSYHLKNVIKNSESIKHRYDINLSRKNSVYLSNH